jgi:hypothetical protein
LDTVEGTLEGYPGVGFAEADWLRMGVVEERGKVEFGV